MAQLSDVLGSIPGLGGYLAKQQFDQQQGTAELANAGQFMRLQQGFQDQAAAANTRVREDKFRQDVAALGPNAPHEKVLAAAVASGLIGAKDVASMFQTEANKNATIAGNKEMAAMRIQAQINKQKDDTDIKLRNAKTAEERNRIIEDHNKITEALQGQAAAVGAANLLYNTGMTVPALNIPQRAPVPNGMPQGRLMTADGQAITDPAEIAAFDAVNSQSQQGLGMSMRQGDNGAFTPVPMAAGQNITAPTGAMPRPMPNVQPQGMPQPMPQVAPQAAPQPMPPVQTAPMPLTISQGGIAPDVAPTVVPTAGQGVPVVRAAQAATAQPAMPPMPPEIASAPKKVQDAWTLATAKSLGKQSTVNRTPEALEDDALYMLINNHARPGSIPTGRDGQGNAYRDALAQKMTELKAKTGMTDEEFASKGMMNKASMTALTNTTRDMAALVPFKEMLDTNAVIAKELGAKIENDKTNSALLNKPIIWLRNNASNRPDISEYLAQLHFVEVEAARVLTQPRLVGQLTDQAIKDMKSVLDGSMTIESTNKVIDRIMQDGDFRVDKMRKERDRLIGDIRGTGRRASDNPSDYSRLWKKNG